jgi:hypothetical protein
VLTSQRDTEQAHAIWKVSSDIHIIILETRLSAFDTRPSASTLHIHQVHFSALIRKKTVALLLKSLRRTMSLKVLFGHRVLFCACLLAHLSIAIDVQSRFKRQEKINLPHGQSTCAPIARFLQHLLPLFRWMADRPSAYLLWTRLHTIFDDMPTKGTASTDDQAHLFKYL